MLIFYLFIFHVIPFLGFPLWKPPVPSSLPVLLYRSSHTQAYPCLPTLTFPYTFFSSAGAAAVEGAGTPEGAAPAAGAGPAAPTLQMRLPVLTLARAFADKPGQKGSMLTPAALMRALILTSVTITLLSTQDQGPLLSLMPDKAILCYVGRWSLGSFHEYSLDGGFVPVSSGGVWLVDVVVLPMGCKPLQLLKSCL